MPLRKSSQTFYFSVEGETEKWYLDWLQNQINIRLESLNADFIVKLDSAKMNPSKYMKRSAILCEERKVVHVFDHEGNVENFRTILKQMSDASKQKNMKYVLGYTNIDFELWMILHKQDFFKSVESQKDYLGPINSAFNEKFQSLKDYKVENNFKRVLSFLRLEDVRSAIRRSGRIQKDCEEFQKCQKWSGFCWFDANPSLSLHTCIADVFDYCKKEINAQRKTDGRSFIENFP